MLCYRSTIGQEKRLVIWHVQEPEHLFSVELDGEHDEGFAIAL